MTFSSVMTFAEVCDSKFVVSDMVAPQLWQVRAVPGFFVPQFGQVHVISLYPMIFCAIVLSLSITRNFYALIIY